MVGMIALALCLYKTNSDLSARIRELQAQDEELRSADAAAAGATAEQLAEVQRSTEATIAALSASTDASVAALTASATDLLADVTELRQADVVTR